MTQGVQLAFEFGNTCARSIALARHAGGLGQRFKGRQFSATRALEGRAALRGQQLFTP